MASEVNQPEPSGSPTALSARTAGESAVSAGVESSAHRTLIDRLARFQALTSALSAAQSASEVANAVLQQAVPALNAFAGVLLLLDEERNELQIVASTGYPEAVVEPWRKPFPMTAAVPLAEAAREQKLVVIDSTDYARYPDMRELESTMGEHGVAAIPLAIDQRLFGVLGTSFAKPRTFSDDERTFMLTLGRQCALALERARLFDSDRGARLRNEENAARLRIAERRSEFLIKAMTLLSSALDYATTVERIAEAAVPDIADACAVYLSDHRNQRIVTVRHVEPEKEERIRELVRTISPSDGHPLAFPIVLSTKRPKLAVGVDLPALERAGADPAWLKALAGLDIGSWILVPIMIHTRVVGAISLLRIGDGRHYANADVILAEALAQRSGEAIDRARLFEAERRAHAEAETANRLKDEFLATISHELRTPLTAILGWATILKSKPDDRKAVERGITIIERNAQAQARLIDDILDVSRIIGGRLRLSMEEVDITTVVNAAVDVVRPAAQAKSLELEVRIEPGLPVVWGDTNRLQQVVWNLTSNAVKFTPQGGHVYVQVEPGRRSVIIRVRDTGEGVSSDFLPHIFERFRQADSSTTRAHGGLGLGLAIVRHLVEMHGGTVAAESAGRDAGSTFTVEIPSRATPPTEGPPRRDSNPDQPAVSGLLVGLKLLVVDDESDARELIAQLLESHGARVITAGSAQIAVRALAELKPHILVSDIGMPGTDGYALIRDVRALGPEHGGDIPSIALTAYARREDASRAIEAGYQMHVAKPIVGAELVRVIAELAQKTRDR